MSLRELTRASVKLTQGYFGNFSWKRAKSVGGRAEFLLHECTRNWMNRANWVCVYTIFPYTWIGTWSLETQTYRC